ncbi:hypothetical protein B0H19DRAFT_956488, partial [Mycena capillaripes]
SVLVLDNFTFPPGDYSATDGNPCGQMQCLPIEYGDCLVEYGCLYNCLEITVIDADACDESGMCDRAASTVKLPFSQAT